MTEDCPPGQQLNNATDQCELCPKGSYRSKTPGEDTWACQLCGNQMTTADEGADQLADCNIPTCSEGYGYDRTQKNCVACPVNTFQSLPGQYWPCEDCPVNQITAGTATTASTGCFLPCSSGSTQALCSIKTQVCVDDANAAGGYRCDCKYSYTAQGDTCILPCSSGSTQALCSIKTQVCVDDANAAGGYRCDCKYSYTAQGDTCIHKCDLTNYCGDKGKCQRSPFKCECFDGYSGEQCTVRPAAATQSDDEVETLVIAVVTTVCGLLFLLLIIVCLCVIAKRRATPTRSSSKSTTAEIDERASIASRSVKNYDDFPSFAINPAYNSKPPSVFGVSMGQGMNGQGTKVYNNDVYFSDDDGDVAVYKP
ncbi:fibropellin-1 [Elysia marginata]|uniref:Fibropellin-1 n=1 Tax=Elysia marginata TaxID=1093978 RepID=A0AAV4G684_9GAST|nr:fibropellin-1 [Elysia marginata]